MLTLGKLKRLLNDSQYQSAPPRVPLVRQVVETFENHFDASHRREVFVHFVPGRVEFLGKHTDYAGGHSIVMALDRGFYAVSAKNGTNRVRMVEGPGPAEPFPPCEFALSPRLTHAPGDWTNYPKTLVQRVASNFQRSDKLQGVDIAFGCDLPVGGGMSGSSALMIMTFFAVAKPNRLAEAKKYQRNILSDLDLAMYLACAENGQTFRELTGVKGVGTFGGSEDHTVILNGRSDTLSIFQFYPTIHKVDLTWRPEWQMAICFSGVQAEKTRAALAHYNRAAERARVVVESYNQQFKKRHSLMRDIIEENDSRTLPHLLDRIQFAVRNRPPEDDLSGRFKQFYVEDRETIPQTAAAWIRGDASELGRLIDRSHRNSKKYLWNIVPEIDFLQRTARELGAVAASGFGAGFGGSVYALIPRQRSHDFLKRWRETYERKVPVAPSDSQFFLTTPSDRARALFDTEG